MSGGLGLEGLQQGRRRALPFSSAVTSWASERQACRCALDGSTLAGVGEGRQVAVARMTISPIMPARPSTLAVSG